MQYGTTSVAPIAPVNLVHNFGKKNDPKSVHFDEFSLIIKESLVLDFHIQDGANNGFQKQLTKMGITPFKMKIY